MFPNNKNSIINWLKNQPLTGGNYLGWRIASILTIGVLIFSAFASVWFIYYNIYTTLTNAAGIIILEATPHWDAVDTAAYDQAQKNLLLKTDVIKWPTDIRNIFDYKE